MRIPSLREILLGAGFGFCVGILLFLVLSFITNWFPDLIRFALIPGKIAEFFTELGIHAICGQSPTMGCASGLGTMIFFALWPLAFGLFWMAIGIAISLAIIAIKRILTSNL